MAMQVLNKLNVYCKNYAEGCVLMTSFENISKLLEHESKGCITIEKEKNELAKPKTIIRRPISMYTNKMLQVRVQTHVFNRL